MVATTTSPSEGYTPAQVSSEPLKSNPSSIISVALLPVKVVLLYLFQLVLLIPVSST